MDQQKDNLNESKMNSRRKFLVRAGAASLLTAVPSKAVWATNCNISGNLSNHASAVARHCSAPVQFIGCKPSDWDDMIKKSCVERDSNNKCIKKEYVNVSLATSVFGIAAANQVFHKDNSALDLKLREVSAVIYKGELSKDMMFGTGDNKGRTIRKALRGDNGEYAKYLAAAYMNAKFGFYPIDDGITPEEYVIGLDDQVKNGVVSHSQMIAAIQQTVV